MRPCVSYAFQTIYFTFILNNLTAKTVTFALSLIVFKNLKGNLLTNLMMYEDGQRPGGNR